jgi:hypothetical protein
MFNTLQNWFDPYSKGNLEKQRFVADTFYSSKLGQFLIQLKALSETKDSSFSLPSFTASRNDHYLYVLYHTEFGEMHPETEIARAFLEHNNKGEFIWQIADMQTSTDRNNNAVTFSWTPCSQQEAASNFIAKITNHSSEKVRQMGLETMQFFPVQGAGMKSHIP